MSCLSFLSICPLQGLDESAVNEKFAEKEAKAQATVLELVGDLSHVDDAPPENVLFVCKLNPVTTEEDLQIIVSTCGVVVVLPNLKI